MATPSDTTRLSDILTAIQNGVTAVNNLATTFPPITNLTTTPPSSGGTAVYNSSLVVAFGLVATSSGGQYRIALLSNN